MFLGRISAVVWAAFAVSVSSIPCGDQQELVLQSDNVQWRVGLEDKKPPPGAPGPRPPTPPHPHPPHPPHEPPNVENKTIFQALGDEPRFSRLFKLVNLTDDVVSVLNDSSASVTFFAVPDWALGPPKHGKHHPHRPHRPHHPDRPEEDEEEAILADILSYSDEGERFVALESLLEQSEDDDKRKKEIIKKIIRAVLFYHILPTALPAGELAKNLTHPTSLKLKDGSLDGQALRVRVAAVPRIIHPVLLVNFYARVLIPDIKAKNGYVHVVNHPIGPPPSAFQILFLVSEVFSTFTSALQRVGLTDAVDWHYVRGEEGEKGTLEGTPSLTVFAPTNGAFKKLPQKLRYFLFSPFGERLLKKLLEFHIAPDFILHSNWQYNSTDAIESEEMFVLCDDYIEDDYPIDELLSSYHFGATVDQPQESGHHLESRGFSFNKLALFGWPPKVPQVPNPPHPKPHPPPKRPPPPPKRPHPPHGDPIYSLNITVPTLLTNHSLHVHIAQFEHRWPLPPHRSSYPTRFIVEGHPALPDIVTRNGALHIVGRLLNPVKGHHGKPHPGDDSLRDEDEWLGWEEWLLKWAEEN